MRILQVAHRVLPHEIGGTEVYTNTISRMLQDRGHECVLLAGSEETSSEPRLLEADYDGLWLVRYSSATAPRHRRHWTREYDPCADALIRRFLALMRPEVVHVHHWMRLTANLVGLCAELGIPTVVTLHDLWISCPRGMRFTRTGAFCTESPSPTLCLTCAEREPWQDDAEIAEAISLRTDLLSRELELASCLLVPSVAQRTLLQKVLGPVAGRIRVLPLGYIADLPVRPTQEAPKFPLRPLQIGFWGHLWPHKGAHLLIEAVRRLPNPDRVAVHIYGGDAPCWYQAQLESAAVGLPIHFYGPFRFADIMRADLDVAIFPSYAHESYAFVIDEAFRCGLPVIVSDRGALPERVGRAGLVFPVEDIDGLAARIVELLDHPERLESLRVAIPQSPSPAMEEHVKELERIYEEARTDPPARESPAADYPRLLAHAMQQLAAREAKLDELIGEVKRLEEDIRLRTTEMETSLFQSRDEANRLADQLTQSQQELTQSRDEANRLADQLTQSRNEADQIIQQITALQRMPALRLQALLARLLKRRPHKP